MSNPCEKAATPKGNICSGHQSYQTLSRIDVTKRCVFAGSVGTNWPKLHGVLVPHILRWALVISWTPPTPENKNTQNTDLLIHRLTHTQTYSYPDVFIHILTHIQTYPYTDLPIHRLTRTQTYSYSDLFILRLTHTQTYTYTDLTHTQSELLNTRQNSGMSQAGRWFQHP
eukprot:4671371-Pyramimonas_sp.AAC.1